MNLLILFFLIYIAIAVVIGIVSSKKETEDGFMIAERKVFGVQLVATLSAGFFDGATISIYTAYVYQFGLSAIWFFVGSTLGFFILRKFVGKIKENADKLGVYSMSEYFYRIFDRKSGLMFSVFILIEYLSLLIVDLIISGKVLSTVFPIPYYLAVFIGGGVISIYLLLAGLKAVIRTDFFQIIIMFTMAVAVASFLLFSKTNISAIDFGLFNAGVGNIIGFLIIGSLSVTVDPALWQRIFASKDKQTLKKALSYASFPLLLLGVLITTIGLTTRQFFPDIAPENSFLVGFSNLLPVGLKEFGLVLLYAVALSSSDTMTFVISSLFTRDLKNYTSRFSQKSMRRLTRFFIVICLLLTIVVGIFYQNIIAIGLTFASVIIALIPVVVGSLYWQLKPNAVFWSLLLSLVSVMVLFFGNYLNPQTAVISLPVALISLIVFQKILKPAPSPKPA